MEEEEEVEEGETHAKWGTLPNAAAKRPPMVRLRERERERKKRKGRECGGKGSDQARCQRSV